MPKPTQIQMYYKQVYKRAEADLLFFVLVKNGMTSKELQNNINKRPSLWGRYKNWLPILP